MKVTALEGAGTYSLEAETPADIDFVGDLYVCRAAYKTASSKDAQGQIVGVTLVSDFGSPEARRAAAGQKALNALGELFSLGLREAAVGVVVSGVDILRPDAEDPKP